MNAFPSHMRATVLEVEEYEVTRTARVTLQWTADAPRAATDFDLQRLTRGAVGELESGAKHYVGKDTVWVDAPCLLRAGDHVPLAPRLAERCCYVYRRAGGGYGYKTYTATSYPPPALPEELAKGELHQVHLWLRLNGFASANDWSRNEEPAHVV